MLIMLECLSLLFISTGRTSFPSKEHYCTTPADAHLGDAADDVRVLAGIVFLIPAEDLHLPAFQDMDLRQWERGGDSEPGLSQLALALPSPAEGSRSSGGGISAKTGGSHLLHPHGASHPFMEAPAISFHILTTH